MSYVLLRRRSLWVRIVRTPALFLAYYRILRAGSGVLVSIQVAALLVGNIYREQA